MILRCKHYIKEEIKKEFLQALTYYSQKKQQE
nr:MAG TPA: hypothetical protein [Caudoviricetes sp.]